MGADVAHSWNGLQFFRRLRNDARKSTPVLMLTARDTLDDKLTGLGFGADDYLTKPFAIQELEARLRALIRRERRQVGSEVLKVADLVLEADGHGSRLRARHDERPMTVGAGGPGRGRCAVALDQLVAPVGAVQQGVRELGAAEGVAWRCPRGDPPAAGVRLR